EAARAVVPQLIRLGAAQRVRRQVLEAGQRTLTQARLQTGIVAPAARRRRRDVGDERRGREQRPPILDRRPRRRVPGAGPGLAPSRGRPGVRGVVAEAPRVHGAWRPYEVFGEHLPLLRELRVQVRIPRAHLARWLVLRPQVRESGGEAAAAGRRIVGSRRLEEERRGEGGAPGGAGCLPVLREPRGRAGPPPERGAAGGAAPGAARPVVAGGGGARGPG